MFYLICNGFFPLTCLQKNYFYKIILWYIVVSRLVVKAGTKSQCKFSAKKNPFVVNYKTFFLVVHNPGAVFDVLEVYLLEPVCKTFCVLY